MSEHIAKDELVRVLRARTDAGYFRADEMLPEIGGAFALGTLIDILSSAPEPLEQTKFYEAVIKLLGEIGGARASAPLMSVFRRYHALEKATKRSLHTAPSDPMQFMMNETIRSAMLDYKMVRCDIVVALLALKDADRRSY